MFGIKRPRLPKYDYRSNGYYFVTVVANWRQNAFSGKEKIVEEKLTETVWSIKGVTVDTLVIMPNHVHFILVMNGCLLPLGEVVRRFKAKVSYELKTQAWQPNYYEHVIRDEQSLHQIREYIINNPHIEQLRVASSGQLSSTGSSRR